MVITDQLDQLAAFEPSPFPVISLYLNTQPDQIGRPRYQAFVRKELKARAKTYPPRSPERESFDRDIERIEQFLQTELRPSTKGLALFACSGAGDFFSNVQLDAPIEKNQLYVYNQPHLYELARIQDQYPRYAAVVLDTNSARLFVFGLRETLDTRTVENLKINRTQVGGWSQARYQRHVDNFYLQHAKEVVDALDRVTREEGIDKVILAGDEVIIPRIQDQLPPHLQEKVIDILRLDIRTPEHEILLETMQALREQDAITDKEKVKRLLDQFRAGGLAVAGVGRTLAALEKGQVDELLLTANVAELRLEDEDEEDTPMSLAVSAEQPDTLPSGQAVLADKLVTLARQTAAGVRFIEDPNLLAEVGGAGAFLRFRL